MLEPADEHPENGCNHQDFVGPTRARREVRGDRSTSAASAERRARERAYHHSGYSAQRWAAERTYHHSSYSAQRIARERRGSVSVCLPAKECAQTVGAIVGELAQLRQAAAIDEIVVVDAASRDGTAAVAERAGAKVYQEAELLPRFGPVLGKGDAMWRALSVMEGELVCYLDADSGGFSAHFATGLLGPLVCEQGVDFVKAFYRRPFEQDGVALPEGGGRVNHLMARPALALFYPQLAEVRQPLAGEVAARRELLEQLPFATGYGVEIAMLIDAWSAVGLKGMAQVDLEVHRNRHQPLQALTPMAYMVLATIARRLEREGRLRGVEGGSAIQSDAWWSAVDGASGSAADGASHAELGESGAANGRGAGVVERPPLASVGVA